MRKFFLLVILLLDLYLTASAVSSLFVKLDAAVSPPELILKSGAHPPATIIAETEPAGVKVFVNGYYKGLTPALITVTGVGGENPFLISFIREGYRRNDLKLELDSGSRRRVSVLMQKKADDNE